MWLLGVFCLQSLEAEAYIPTFNVCCPLIRLTPVHTTYRIRATSLCVRKNSLFQLPAALLSTFCPWNSAPRLIIALLTAFDHVDTRFTPLSCHVYSILDVLVVHCRHSGGKCLDLSAWVSARSFRGSPRCALTLTMNGRAPRITLSLTHSMIVFMMSAFASPASVVRGPLPIHLNTLSRVVSLSHKYSRSTSGGVACSVLATAANSGSELAPSSSRPTRTTRHLFCRWRQTLPAPISPLYADPSPAHVP